VAAQPINEIAVEAINLLLNIIHGEEQKTNIEGIVIEPVIIKRNSSPKKKMMSVIG
jgi:DNA-binding LacI/PurR family transcriptional regulator